VFVKNNLFSLEILLGTYINSYLWESLMKWPFLGIYSSRVTKMFITKSCWAHALQERSIGQNIQNYCLRVKLEWRHFVTFVNWNRQKKCPQQATERQITKTKQTAQQADNITPCGFRHKNGWTLDKLNLRSQQLVPNYFLYPNKHPGSSSPKYMYFALILRK